MQTITNLGRRTRVANPDADGFWELIITKDGGLVGHAELPAIRRDVFNFGFDEDLREIFGRTMATAILSVLPHLYCGTSVDLGYGIKAELRTK